MKPATEQDYHERIVRTLVYIQRRLDDELTLEEAAGVAAFSAFHFHRVFRGLVGEPFKEHVRRLRLERAAQRLKHLDKPVTGLALDAGFETHEAFTRAFKAMFGTSPSDYRAAHKPAPESPSGTHFEETSGYHPPDYGEPLRVEVKELPALRIVFLRHVGPYGEVGATWGRLCAWAGPRGLLGPRTRMLGISYDDPDVTPPDKLRYEAAITTDRPVEPEGEIGVRELPGGKHALVTHKGPYQDLSKTYQRLCGDWLPKSGYEPRNTPAIEDYLNPPDTTKPEDLLTLIHLPLE
jgi:AraC family transcriptional regulator